MRKIILHFLITEFVNRLVLEDNYRESLLRLGSTAWRVDVCFNAPLKLVIFLPKLT